MKVSHDNNNSDVATMKVDNDDDDDDVGLHEKGADTVELIDTTSMKYRTSLTLSSSSLSSSSSSFAVSSSLFDRLRFLAEQEDVGTLAACDESLCVSNIRDLLLNGQSSFTCYSGTVTNLDPKYGNYTSVMVYPMMCADGFIPEVVESKAVSIVTSNKYTGTTRMSLDYFTCCPPNNVPYDGDTERQCSDPIIFSNAVDAVVPITFKDVGSENTEEAVCVNASQPYLRQMKNLTSYNYTLDQVQDQVSFVCCDSKIDTTPTDFFNVTECVPYVDADEYYLGIIYRNGYGTIQGIFCDDNTAGFIHPNFSVDSKFYECCKLDQGVGHFITDAGFKTTVYPQVFLSAVACICSATLIIALWIPLVYTHKPQSRTITTTATTTNTASTSSNTTTTTTTARTRTRTTTRIEYSSYNLYLLYLALPDLFLNAYLLVVYSRYAMQIYNPETRSVIVWGEGKNKSMALEGAIIISACTANMYLNCVITYEVYLLLRNNAQVVRHKPPTLRRVSLQAGGVYLFSITVLCTNYFVDIVYTLDPNINFIWTIIITYVFPLSYFFSVWLIIKHRNYFPSLTGRWKELVLFYFRIIFIFCLVWLPGMFLITVGDEKDKSKLYQAGLIFCAIQPIISTIMAMTKADVRKYTINLLTLSYLFDKDNSN